MGLSYFIADTHLGLDYQDPVKREKQFASFLESLPQETSQVFLLGDIFDFWYEYKDVIPRKFTRTLGALARLADRGVKLFFINGNHDIWTYSYLQTEIGVTILKQPHIVDIDGSRFCIGHGDAVWYSTPMYRFMNAGFKNRVLQVMFSSIHPRWAMMLGHGWSRHNRLTRFKSEDDKTRSEYKEALVRDASAWAVSFQKDLEAKGEKKADHFIFGHYHIPLDFNVEGGGDFSILGDWIHNPDYLVFDGANLKRETPHFENIE
ncbi:MAG: UDP-2,3-diacylglucosamine diphosphatase [Bacteroidales bacterium]|nr:UDP-2,3-diacylglucosamine diphosphatase [Bacteroidales bacterium]